MVEFHSLWQLLPAMPIARALAPYKTFWHEDPIKMDSLATLKRYAEASTAPICASETLAAAVGVPRPPGNRRRRHRDAGHRLVRRGLGSRKIAAMAEAWHLPVAPHDCTGPVVLAASTHLSLNAPNALVQESVRAYYRTWYRDIVTGLPEVKDGTITRRPAPGHGIDLLPDLDKRFTLERGY